jgi:hypothetical protein
MGSLSHSVVFYVMSEELLKGWMEKERKKGNGGFRKLGRRGVGKGEGCRRVGFGVRVGYILRVLDRKT